METHGTPSLPPPPRDSASIPCSCIQVVSWNGRLKLQGAGGTWFGVDLEYLWLLSDFASSLAGESTAQDDPELYFFIHGSLPHWLCLLTEKENCTIQVVLMVKNLPANAGDIRDTGSIPGLDRFPGGGLGNALQYSCLENPMDRGAWQATVRGVAKSWTRPKGLCMHMQKLRIMFYLADILRT